MDLECSRDDLMYEQYRMDSKNIRDMKLIENYFGKIEHLSDELAKQLWMVIQRSIATVRKDPTLLVSVVRIIEREEKIDRRMNDRKKQTGFIPPGRPKKWKDRMFLELKKTIGTRIEGSQADTRESDKMWLVRHLEIIRRYVLDDLIIAKNLMVQCFPPSYNIFNNVFELYHHALSTRIEELASEDLEANEIVSLLTWVLNTYHSFEMMGNPELSPEVDVKSMKLLLSQEIVDELLHNYMATLQSNIIAWLRKALETDKNDWGKDTEPEADQDGYYQTTLPAIVFQMFEQNLQVADQIGEELKKKVLLLCLQQMNTFLTRYCEEAQLYKEEHMRNRQLPACYVQYMIAIINNCQTFKESILSLKNKYLRTEKDVQAFGSVNMDSILDKIASDGCKSLLDEVFMDLEQHLNDLITRKWFGGSNSVDTICVTIEDYFNDFAKIKTHYKQKMTITAHRKVVMEYIKAIMQKRICFRNAEERKEGAERMIKEAEQLHFLFKRLTSGFTDDTEGLCQTIIDIAEVIKLTDPSLLYLEISTLVTKYPGLRDDHIAALLAVRGDASREMKQTILETVEQSQKQHSPNNNSIFNDINVPSLPSLSVPKLLK